MKRLLIDFETKSSSKGLVIEGFANANTFDRARERIEPKGWKLDNYKKNPVILFDHGHDLAFGSMPIGKATHVEPMDNGLFIKAKISESKTEKISAIRDLIEEGILKTFSVGFNPLEESQKSNDGDVIPSAELIENSVVPVPMNQDSVFCVSNRSFKSALANEWFTNYSKIHELYKKGSRFAAIVNDYIRKSGKKFPEIMQLLKNCGINEDMAISIIDGIHTKVDNETINIFSKALDYDFGSVEIFDLKGETTMDQSQDEDKGCGKKPKEKEMTPEEMGAAMEQYHAECSATATDGPGNPPSWVADEAAWSKAKEAADQSYSREDAEKYYSVVTWLYLNRFGGSMKSMPMEEEKPKEGEEEKSAIAQNEKQAMATGDSAVPPDQNPYLELAKQTNVLLGSLVAEMQKVNLKMEKLVEPAKEPEEAQDSGEMPPVEDETKKMIAKIQKTQEDLRKRIERFSAE